MATYSACILTNSRFSLKILFSVSLLILSSKITIPAYPVPFNLQTLTLFLLPLLYNTKVSLLSVVIWILMGCIGFPVFSGSLSGIQVILGPTGGYLIGMAVASYLFYFLSISSFNKNLYLLSIFIIFFCGVSWLSQFIGIKEALFYGLFIFIPSELIKAALFFKTYRVFLQKD